MRTLPGHLRPDRPLTLALCLLLALGAAGCDTVRSADLRTSGISASITVTAHDDGSDVVASLGAGGLTSVELLGEDQLVALAGDDPGVTLDEESFLGSHTYTGTVGDGRPGSIVRVALRRGSDDDDAPGSVVRLPGPVTVERPRDGATVHRRRDLLLRVSDGDGSVRVAWEGSCVEPGELDVAEGEPVVLPADAVRRAAESPRRCTLTLTVSRVRVGDLDPAYDGGSITALRPTAVAVTTVP